MKILICDDSKMARQLLLRHLEIEGHDVTVTKGGEEALTAFDDDPGIQVVITDWMMPHIDGLEVCRRIRNADRQTYVYIVLLTAKSGKESYLTGLEAGADDFISKPFDKDELSARLKVAERIVQLQRHVQSLEKLLPICMCCKKIRDDAGAWQQVDHYIRKRTDTEFTHGICPDCYEEQLRRA